MAVFALRDLNKGVNAYHKVVLHQQLSELWLSGREKIIDGQKEPDLAQITFQTVTTETTHVEVFLFYTGLFTATTIL